MGLFLGAFVILLGGGTQRRRGVVEFYGRGVDVLFARIPFARSAAAMTLGHVVLGRTASALDEARNHELIHVRQYERWGPLFIPIYFLCSAWMWLQGRDAYRDNPFEVEAYCKAKSD